MTEPLERLQAALADRYRLERELGAGGMATVYLAEDLKHHRHVALKVLRPELSAVLGAERFLKEIELTANLQHPHLLPLFDSGEAAGLLYYVMPYIEGESLRARLIRDKQLGIDEAVRLTAQVASALDYAHRHGVLHRDIKPENILIHEGQALIADFGIALALRQAGGSRLTETGLSLGTPQYMSPEQAGGDRVLDARSDVYSLACVLYEMLTGEPPHTGPTVQAVIAKLLSAPIRPVTELRTTVPVHVAQALEVALAKLPADRFSTAAEFGAALEQHGHAVGSASSTARTPQRAARGWDPRSLVLLAATIVLGTALVASLLRGPRGGTRVPAVYDIGLPDSAPISFTGGSPWGEGWTALAVSPKADFAVYVAQRGSGTELWYRSLVDTVARPIPGTSGAYHPMLSPDGSSVAFFAGNQLLAVPLAGGSAVPIGEVDRPQGGQWAEPGSLLVADSNGAVLRSFNPAARSVRIVARGWCPIPRMIAEGEVICSGTLGGGVRVALRAAVARSFTPGDTAARTFRVGTRGDDPNGELLAGSHFTWLGLSDLVFITAEGALAGATLDVGTYQAGSPVTLVRGVRREGFDSPAQYAVSGSGTLVYVPGENAEVGKFASLREGRGPEELPIPPAAHHRFDITRDGRRLASAMYSLAGMELWVYDVATGRGERWLTAALVAEPRWDPVGERLMVQVVGKVGEPAVTILGVPGSSLPPDTILTGTQSMNVFSYPGDSLVLGARGPEDLPVRVDLRVDPPRIDSISPMAVFASALSPNGRWLTYSSGSSGLWEVFLEPFPADGRRVKVSPRGGLEPLWRSPSDLVFRRGSIWYSVRIDPGSLQHVAEPRPIFSDSRFIDTWGRSNALAPDGSIIYLRGTAQATGAFLRVVPGFADQVHARVREGHQ